MAEKKKRILTNNPTQKEQKQAMDAFLEAFEELGDKTAAARKVGIHRTTAYNWEKGNVQGFVERLAESRSVVVDQVEGSLFSLALEKHDCSKTQLTAKFGVLKAYKPDKYRERVDVASEGEITLRVKYDDDSGKRE